MNIEEKDKLIEGVDAIEKKLEKAQNDFLSALKEMMQFQRDFIRWVAHHKHH